VLFARLEDKVVQGLRDKYSGSQKEREEKKPAPEEVFAKTVSLRTAEIVNVERIPKADKLFKLTLNIGSPEAPEPRVICSGLVGFYTEEQLLHKHIIVVYNLKGRVMRGVESKGMLLAAGDEKVNPDGTKTEIVDVLDSGSVPSGTWLSVEGFDVKPEEKPAEITIDQFLAVPMRATNHVVNVNGKALLLGGPGSEPVKAVVVADGGVH
jgi:methionyl-tRNA synthetase